MKARTRITKPALLLMAAISALAVLLAGAAVLGQPVQVRVDGDDDEDKGFAYRILGTVAVDFPNGLVTLSLWSTKDADRAKGQMVWSDVILEDKDAPRLRFAERLRFMLFTDQGSVEGTGKLWFNSTQKEAEVVTEFFPGSGTSVAAVHARLIGTDEEARTVEAQLDGLFEVRFGEPFLEGQINKASLGEKFLPPPGSVAEATLAVQYTGD